MLTTPPIGQAIRECVDRCKGTETPLASLALYLDDLRQSGWLEEEIHSVELGVVRLLREIIGPTNDARHCPKCSGSVHLVVADTADETVFRCDTCHHQWSVANA